ncbi:hypothetical protein [Aliarcobacter thereius]|uniref:Transposase n=1 Tax=Aliarcobacter thereius LMG 24486 TaxID=1032240 RepID=A0A1C7WPK3_9BACT|nr:hypothetical protein [Aliarcobacter thereius]OCL95671.1 hypothetical protein AA347_01149 [Aliarcobacter thereius LMG 24486]QBF16342.1 hypothetical protein ATH_1296 [Aliarcobacter thereius LMG 24486]TLS91600.1 hypothetical protein FE244_08785 [Aliarcobacter thereius]
MQFKSYTMNILIDLLDGKQLTATDKHYSNTNQYFNKIKKRGIELVEMPVQNKQNSQKHLKRFLVKSEENIKKAKDYLDYLAYCNRNRNRKN